MTRLKGGHQPLDHRLRVPGTINAARAQQAGQQSIAAAQVIRCCAATQRDKPMR